MMADQTYNQAPADVAMNDGGSVRLTIASTVAQGSDVPCRHVWVQGTTGNSGVTRVNINDAATASLGVVIPVDTLADNGGYWEANINNLNKLQFYGTNADTIDITYVR